MPGVSGQRKGRHRRDVASPKGPWRRALESAAVSVGICAGCCVILVAIYAYIASVAAGRATRLVWRWLGLRGRLKVAMSASPFAALAASGIDPRAWAPATVAAMAAFTVAGVWLAVLGVLGRRQWRQRGGAVVITGGGDSETVVRNTVRLDALEGNLSYIVAGMERIAVASGLRMPDVESTQPGLQAVGSLRPARRTKNAG